MIDWRYFVEPGTVVEPKPVWNETEPTERHLAGKVQVIRVVDNRHCLAERSFVVKAISGAELDVPALWFERMVRG